MRAYEKEGVKLLTPELVRKVRQQYDANLAVCAETCNERGIDIHTDVAVRDILEGLYQRFIPAFVKQVYAANAYENAMTANTGDEPTPEEDAARDDMRHAYIHVRLVAKSGYQKLRAHFLGEGDGTESTADREANFKARQVMGPFVSAVLGAYNIASDEYFSAQNLPGMCLLARVPRDRVQRPGQSYSGKGR